MFLITIVLHKKKLRKMLNYRKCLKYLNFLKNNENHLLGTEGAQTVPPLCRVSHCIICVNCIITQHIQSDFLSQLQKYLSRVHLLAITKYESLYHNLHTTLLKINKLFFIIILM